MHPSLALTLTLLAVPALAQTQGIPQAILDECPAADRLPEGRYALVDEWEAEGARCGHNGGGLLQDLSASEGLAWAGVPGRDQAATLLFGPYLEDLPESDYVVFLRLRTDEEISEEPYGLLDACVNYAQTILGAWEVMGSDLVPNEWVQVPLGFHLSGGKLECRLTWNGYAAIAADRFTLFRLEEGSLGAGKWRVPEPVASGEPNNLTDAGEQRPFPDIFPRSEPPAERLCVFDARALPPDRRMATFVLQGLVNRESPSLYCLSGPNDEQWLEHILKRGWVESTETIATFDDLMARFGGRAKGAVVTDPALPASKNVATMVASVEDALVCSPRLQAELGLPIIEDLRGRWTTSADAYRWAFDALWPRLNHHVIACSYPEHLALRDYLVRNRVFIFWLSGSLDGARPYADPDAEVRLMEDLLSRMPTNIPVMSYPWAGKGIGIGEGPGVTLFAEFGKYLVGSIDCPNLTVHSGIRAPELKREPSPPPPALDPSKAYYSFVISDGDNLPVLTSSNFPQLWREETRGTLPIGWTLSPSASILLPDLVDYYYSTSTPNDDWMCAVSGVGYTYPDSYGKRYVDRDRERIYDEFLDQTADYMARCDLRGAWIMNATRPEIISRFAERIPNLESLFPDYGRRLLAAEDLVYPTARNAPVFHAATTWSEQDTREERIDRMVRDIREMTAGPRPAFAHAFVLNWFADLSLLAEVKDRLGPDYVCVRPDHLASLYRRHLATCKVLVRLPADAAVIEGTSLLMEGAVRNVTDAPLTVRLSAEAGLRQAEVTPAEANLAPGESVSVRVTGRPAGEEFALVAEGGFGRVERRVRLRAVRREEILGDLPDAPLIPTSYLEAEGLAHRSGEAVHDTEASGGIGWTALVGRAEPGYIAFGPYAALPEGRYLALFRVMRMGEGTGPLATLDAGPAGGEATMTARTIACADLPNSLFRYVPLVFDHTGGQYETRVLWTGSASLAVDSVILWRIEE